MKRFTFLMLIVVVIFFTGCKDQTTPGPQSEAGQSYQLIDKESYSGFPGKVWTKYADPAKAGWSKEMLEQAEHYLKDIGSAAMILVHDGAIVFEWGEVDKKFYCHSIRKSLLFALYGIHVKKGSIDLNKTLAELKIDDEPPLTDDEKQARVIDLLKCRSGVYHAAAAEAPEMKATRPQRGSHKPDTFYYYNNWDFNVLGTIFEQETGTKIFEDFYKQIAVPLQMEHFQVSDGDYYYEKELSLHASYPFFFISKDMARFCLFYLRIGKWEDKQIIPESWVKDCITPYSRYGPFGVGFKWTTFVEGPYHELGVYFTTGYGGHVLVVAPKEKLVFVHRANTFDPPRYVPMEKIEPVLQHLMLANPNLIPAHMREKFKPLPLSKTE